MREIQAQEISKTVAGLFCDANFNLTEDVLAAIQQAAQTEESPVAKEVLEQILKNAEIAAKEQIPLCQDCGASVVFAEIGQDVHIAVEILMTRSMRECGRPMTKDIYGNQW
jgi:fumarate hydratase subunit alpha